MPTAVQPRRRPRRALPPYVVPVARRERRVSEGSDTLPAADMSRIPVAPRTRPAPPDPGLYVGGPVAPRVPPSDVQLTSPDVELMPMRPAPPPSVPQVFDPAEVPFRHGRPTVTLTPEEELMAREDPTYQPERRGKVGTFLQMLLRSAGPAFQSSLERAAASGRPYGPWDFGQGAAAALGASTVSAFDPYAVGRYDNEQRIAELQPRVAQAVARREHTLKLEDQRAQTRLRNAQATYAEARPDLEATKTQDAHMQRERAAALSVLRMKAGQHQAFDTANPMDIRLLAKLAGLGIEIDPDSWNDAGSNLVAVDVIEPDRPTTKQRRWLNKATGELSESGPVTGYVQPVSPRSGMTSAQEAGVTDRRAGQAETRRFHDVQAGQGAARIAQGQERIGISRDSQAQRGQPTANSANVRLGRASELARLLAEEKTKAEHPPRFIQGIEQTEAQQRAYSARHLGLARNYAQQLRDGYSDVYESSPEGDGGWPYAKPLARPATAPPRGAAAPARPRIRQANVGAAVDDLLRAGRFADRQSAEAYVRTHMDVIP